MLGLGQGYRHSTPRECGITSFQNHHSSFKILIPPQLELRSSMASMHPKPWIPSRGCSASRNTLTTLPRSSYSHHKQCIICLSLMTAIGNLWKPQSLKQKLSKLQYFLVYCIKALHGSPLEKSNNQKHFVFTAQIRQSMHNPETVKLSKDHGTHSHFRFKLYCTMVLIGVVISYLIFKIAIYNTVSILCVDINLLSKIVTASWIEAGVSCVIITAI